MKRLLTSCFGFGYLPVAPGTWGSLPPAVLFALLCYLNSPAILTSIVMAASVLAGSVICVKFAPAIIASTGKKDPGEVVADEFAGQALTFLAIPFLVERAILSDRFWIVPLLGFLLFRFFDIIKPWPIHRLEKLPGGWGVLADDLLAGVYAAVVLYFCLKLWNIS